MRSLALVVALALAAPAAYAQESAPRPRPAPAPGRSAPAPAPAPGGGRSAVGPRVAPAPIPPAIARPPAGAFPRPTPPSVHPGAPRYPAAPYYPYGHHYPYGYYYPFAPPFWLGFGLGWDYYYPTYPTYPPPGVVVPPPGAYPAYPPPPPAVPPPEPPRITTRLEVRGGWQSGGATGGLGVGIEGKHLGFQAGIDAVSVKSVTGSASLGSEGALGWGTMHLTWSVVSEDAYRLRLEVGGSLLSMPNSGALIGQPYAGNVAFGPDFGLSGQVHLVGPLGLEAHARVTPIPVAVTDTLGALTLRGGPLAFTGGWRFIDVNGNNTDAPQLHFSGPQFGVSFVF